MESRRSPSPVLPAFGFVRKVRALSSCVSVDNDTLGCCWGVCIRKGRPAIIHEQRGSTLRCARLRTFRHHDRDFLRRARLRTCPLLYPCRVLVFHTLPASSARAKGQSVSAWLVSAWKPGYSDRVLRALFHSGLLGGTVASGPSLFATSWGIQSARS